MRLIAFVIAAVVALAISGSKADAGSFCGSSLAQNKIFAALAQSCAHQTPVLQQEAGGACKKGAQWPNPCCCNNSSNAGDSASDGSKFAKCGGAYAVSNGLTLCDSPS